MDDVWARCWTAAGPSSTGGAVTFGGMMLESTVLCLMISSCYSDEVE